MELPRAHGTKRKPFTDDEVKTVIAAAAESATGVRDKAIIVLGLATALRPVETWQLQLTDVDLREGWLSVRLDTTKTDAGERVVPLDPQSSRSWTRTSRTIDRRSRGRSSSTRMVTLSPTSAS